MSDVKKRETDSREAAYRKRLKLRVSQADAELKLIPAIKMLRDKIAREGCGSATKEGDN